MRPPSDKNSDGENPEKKENLLGLLSVPGRRTEAVLEAIKNGADVNISNGSGFTPLMFAVLLNDDPTLIRALLEAGAEVDAENNEGITALMWSLQTETCDHTGRDMPEFLKRERNRRAVVTELLRSGADANSVCYSKRRMKWTPLLFATCAPDLNASAISALIRSGANVNAQTEEALTPLFHAAANGRSSDAVRELLEAGAEVDAAGKQKGREGWTPLLYALAAPYRSLPIVRELIKNGAEVNLTVRGGFTPLLFAVEWGNPEAVSELLKAGAKVDARDKDGNSALDCAMAKNYKQVVRRLLNAGTGGP